MSSTPLMNLTAATRLHLLSNKPSNVRIDTVVTILEACTAKKGPQSKLAAGQDYLWALGDAKFGVQAYQLKSLSPSEGRVQQFHLR